MSNFYNPEALVMIQPHSLPGSYLNNGETFKEIESNVLSEAQMIASFGFDGFILQNMHDGPSGQNARPETYTYMTTLGLRLKQEFPELKLGILVNWDGVASLAVADAICADFVRVEHLYTGVSVDVTGYHYGQCADILSLKKRIGSRMPIYVDVMEVNANYIAANPKPKAAKSIIKSAYADGLFMSGNNTQESLDLIKETRRILPDTRIYLGGGATGDNIYDLLKYYDGVSVATWIKDGDMKNPINPEKAKKFISECNRAKEWRLLNN